MSNCDFVAGRSLINLVASRLAHRALALCAVSALTRPNQSVQRLSWQLTVKEVGPNDVIMSNQLATLAAHHAVPAIYPTKECVYGGGLMGYGADFSDAYRVVGSAVSSKAKSPTNCRSSRRRKLSWLSTSRPPRHSALPFRRNLLAIADEVIE